LTVTAYTVIINHGKIANTASASGVGVYLAAGANLTNAAGAVISGSYYGSAIVSKTSARIFNQGTINGASDASIYLKDGGFVYNGGYDRTAVINGDVEVIDATGIVDNSGVINGSVGLGDGGNVVNGSGVDTTALIAYGVRGDSLSSTVTNFGTISGLDIINFPGVFLGGGAVINGSTADTAARIIAGEAVQLVGPGTVTNFGTITATSSQSGTAGVSLQGGEMTNGAMTDRAAVVSGYTAVSVTGGSGTVTNFGTIEGLGVAATQFGIHLGGGGEVTNGGGSDRSALIAGATAVLVAGGYGTVMNFGTVSGEGGPGSYGAVLDSGGYIANGSRNNAAALIEGYAGLALNASAGISSAVYNFGTVAGLADGTGGVGAVLGVGGARLINEAGGLVEGELGVSAGAYALVENYGTIRGSGIAIAFTSSNATLVVEAGSTFIGESLGDGGTLDLGSGAGTISNLANGNLTVSGSMAPATFDGFNVLEVSAGAIFSGSGGVTIALGESIDDAGALTLGGAGATIANAGLVEVAGTGTLVLAGAVTGKGTATIAGGTLHAASSFSQNVTFTGTAGEQLELAQSQGYTGSISGFSRTGATSFDLLDIVFVSASEATFSGTTKGGLLTVTDGTHTAHINLKGNYTGSTWMASSDGHGGTIVVDPKAKALAATTSPSPHAFVAAIASMGAPAASWAEPAATVLRSASSMLLGPRISIA
jgi:hypothetical protein